MTYQEQHKTANSERNLKGLHHGYIVRDCRHIVREDGLVTCRVRVQTPYYDIPPACLQGAVYRQFPALHGALRRDTWSALDVSPESGVYGLRVAVREIGYDRYAKSRLLEITLDFSATSAAAQEMLEQWSAGTLQRTLDSLASPPVL